MLVTIILSAALLFFTVFLVVTYRSRAAVNEEAPVAQLALPLALPEEDYEIPHDYFVQYPFLGLQLADILGLDFIDFGVFDFGEADYDYEVTFDNFMDAYYAGQIETAIQMLSLPEAPFYFMDNLIPLYWELGENARAAHVIEQLLQSQHLPLFRNDELMLKLFMTRVLQGNYTQAAMLRGFVVPAVERMNNRLRAEFYFYNALVFHAMGDLENAERYYRQSLALYEWRSLAWYRLGTIIIDRDPEEAENAFQTAWNKDGALTNALLPLARLLSDRGVMIQARNHLITANERRPYDPEIALELAEALRRIGPPGDGLYFIRREITAIPPQVTPAPITPGEGVMRIGLNINRPLVSVKAGGVFTIRDVYTGIVLHTGAGREQFWVQPGEDGEIVVFGRNNRELLRSSVPIVYMLHSNHNTSIVAGVVTGSPGLNRTYRGDLEFRLGEGGLTVINIVNMGDYLYGVVPAEFPPAWPQESLYVQAIISRSYAIAYRGTFAELGFDIWNDARSQSYLGVAFENPLTSAAVDATRGIVLVGETNQILAAYYSANHGGHSEDSLVMWGYDAYMSAVQDPRLPERNSPLSPDALFRWIRSAPFTYSNMHGFFFPNTYRWERWVCPQEIRRRLILDARVAEDPGEIQRIVTRGRGISGRIVELEVQGTERNVRVRGNAIWFTMGGLRSSLFTIRSKHDSEGRLQYFVFQGAGYGHGIGVDQHAAAAMAGAGMSAIEIMRFFYPRAELRQLYYVEHPWAELPLLHDPQAVGLHWYHSQLDHAVEYAQPLYTQLDDMQFYFWQ